MQTNRLFKDVIGGFAAAICLLIIFILFSQSLTLNWLNNFDTIISDAVYGMRSDGLTTVALIVTSLGNGSTETILCLLVGAVLYFKFKHKWETLVLFLAVLGTWGLNSLLKGIFERARPVGKSLIVEHSFSFPSGHAMVSTLFYGLIGYLLFVNLQHKWKQAWLIPVITVMVIFSIGLSRVYLGVHYPSDVVAGFVVGGAILIGSIMGLREIRYRRSRR